MSDKKLAHYFVTAAAHLGLAVSAFLLFVGVALASASAATFIAPAPVGRVVTAQVTGPTPKCALVTDKDSYSVGSTVKLYWLASNTSYTTFVPNDSLALPTGQFGHSGAQTFVASTAGDLSLSMEAYNAEDQSAICSKTISVTL